MATSFQSHQDTPGKEIQVSNLLHVDFRYLDYWLKTESQVRAFGLSGGKKGQSLLCTETGYIQLDVTVHLHATENQICKRFCTDFILVYDLLVPWKEQELFQSFHRSVLLCFCYSLEYFNSHYKTLFPFSSTEFKKSLKD